MKNGKIMIQAELKGKVPEVENKEDVLTSNVFGLIKYLPPKEGLLKILEAAKDYSDNRKTLPDNLRKQDIILENYVSIDYLFWEKSSKHGEPDLILILKSSDLNMKDLMVCIEVKYLSEKSREGEYDQLMDYCLSLESKKSRKTYNNKDVANFDGLFLGLIYLTYFSQYRSVQESLKQIKKKGLIDFEKKLYELRWNEITKILSEIKSENKYINKIHNDLVLLLQKKNFVDFKGFSKVNFDLQYKPLFSFSSKPRKPVKIYFRGFRDLDNPNILECQKHIFLEVQQ